MTSNNQDLFTFNEIEPVKEASSTVVKQENLQVEEKQVSKKDLPLVLVDGSGFIFRAYYAVPPMNRADGIMVNAVYGFCSMLLRVVSDYPENPIAVIFDTSHKTFRSDFYADYKAHRPPPPEELIPQFGLIREAVEKFGISSIELPGFEADDLIATYAKLSVEDGSGCYVVTSDKDMMQLIRPGVTMLDPMKNIEVGLQAVEKKFGVTPDKVCDVQALMGDSADNVPGVPGIGAKGAAQLVNEYGGLEEILAKAPEMKPSKRRDSLIEYAEQARISYRLVTLEDNIKDLPVPFNDLSAAKMSLDVLKPWLEEMNFSSIIRRVGGGLKKTKPSFQKEVPHVGETSESMAKRISSVAYGPYEVIENLDGLLQLTAEVKQGRKVALSFFVHQDQTWIGIAYREGKSCAVQLEVLKNSKEFIALLSDRSVLKIASDIKSIIRLFEKHEITNDLAPYDDVSVMSYSQYMGKFSQKISTLSEKYLGHDYVDPNSLTKTLLNSEEFVVSHSVAEQADVVFRLAGFLKSDLRDNKALTLYEDVDRPLVNTLARMEEAGVTIDPAKLKEASRDFLASMKELEKDIFAAAGEEFLISSPKQLGEVLFDKMGLPSGKKTKTGAWSTDANVLEELCDTGHAIARNVLDWRKFDKLRSTYTETLADHISPKTDRLHTTYHMTLTNTGRLSSSDPNLQNIPVRTPEAARIRQSFIARPGHKIVSADYSQIELRILAGVAGIETFIDAFAKKEDIHKRTASEVFGIPREQVDGDNRRKAKAINFGIVYGISAFGLARQLQISNYDAKTYIDSYFAQYPGINIFTQETIQSAQKNGYVVTPFGRRCYIRDIHAKGPRGKGAERQAVNAPIQGGAADVIKYAMNNLDLALAQSDLKARMILQVHDELVFEVPDDEVTVLTALIKDKMENAVNFSVPLEVEIGIGENWEEAH